MVEITKSKLCELIAEAATIPAALTEEEMPDEIHGGPVRTHFR